MSVRVVLDDTGFGLRAGIVVGERLVDLRDVDAADDAVTDALFVARVRTVDAKINAAFLDCGLAEPGFLAAKDARALRGATGRPPIRDLVREGETVLVQGMRESEGDKGPRFSTDVRLFGYAVVHRPLWDGGRTPTEREQALFPQGGFALRRHAGAIDDAALLDEAAALGRRWTEMRGHASAGSSPGRLPVGDGPLERMLHGLLDVAPEVIEVADTALHAQLRRRLDETRTLPQLALERLPHDQAAFVGAGIDDELEQALAVEVALHGGGRLLIEPTAALVAIDVDGGGRAPLDVDLAAAREVALQLRLRNLGGTVVIDFVDVPGRHERKRVEEALKRACRDDPLGVQVHGMSALGLVELSRVRRGRPLADLLTRRCPACGGARVVPSLRSQAERLVDQLRRAQRAPARIRAAADLGRWLQERSGIGWEEVSARHAPGMALTIDRALPSGQFVLE